MVALDEILLSPSSVKLPLAGSSTPNLHELQMQNTSDDQEVCYLFPDIIALESICGGESYEYENETIVGFEIYIVEQWACERKYGTVITSYTGDSDHSIKVGKIRLPADTSKWSSKMTHFFQEIAEYCAKPKMTNEGILFITNLSSFPSNLNLLPISSGSIVESWEFFKVNVDLRRMQCGGRSAVLLSEPSDACGDKFRQIYKTHPKVDVKYAVKELVSLVQICLVDFKLLDPNFVDGLLCDKTVQKIEEWWNLFGSAYYGTTPKDGLLGPTTVSAILGFVLSCHFRLDIAGSDFPKEPFNYFSFRVNVGKFQKQYNLKRTWYLDPITVEKLFRVTTKISNTDISKLKKVVKSTVQDISGKGSSIQFAPEVLTLDLDKLLKYFNCSARLSYLWYAKGDIRDIKGFDYHERGIPASSLPTSSLRTGVDKIRNLPKRLQDESATSDRKPENKGPDLCDDVCGTISSDVCDNLAEGCKIGRAKRISDDRAFKKELHRRSSIPMIRKDICINQIAYENLPIARNSKIETENILKRSKSFSFVEGSINQWEVLPSPYYMGQKVKAVKNKIQLHEKSAQYFNRAKIGYSQTLERSQKESGRLTQLLKPINRSYELQSQADQRARIKMEDIQALSARLEYEIRVLSTRIRDTEESVDHFVAKVEALEKSVTAETCISLRREVLNSTQSEPSTFDFCWYQVTSRFDTERLKGLWMRIDPSFGYANWISGWFGSPQSIEEKTPKVEIPNGKGYNDYDELRQANYSNEKAKQT